MKFFIKKGDNEKMKKERGEIKVKLDMTEK